MFIYTIHDRIIVIIMIIIMISSSISFASNNFTIIYLSDIKFDLNGGTQTIHTLKSQARNDFIEEFNNPPYTEIATWCSRNNWSYSGNYPCWWGILWLGVTSNGKLRWHNWFHSIGGAIYNFSMWKDFNSPGTEWEFYVPINSWRVSGGVAGAPNLYIHIELYDKFGFRLFRVVLTYNSIQRFNSIIAEIYGINSTVSSLYASTLDLKLWQNSTGVYFSYNNGSSVVLSSRLYTEPTRLLLRFYTWEYNPIQPYSDYEFYVEIDRITLISKNKERITFILPPGDWYLLDMNGRILANSQNNFIDYNSTDFEGMLIGLIDQSYAISDTFYTNSTIILNGTKLSHIQNPPKVFSFLDDCSSISEWMGSHGLTTSERGYEFGTKSGFLYVYGGARGPYDVFMERSLSIYGYEITIMFNTRVIPTYGYIISSYLTGVYLKLHNGSLVNILTSQVNLANGNWQSINLTYSSNIALTITGIRFTWHIVGSGSWGYFCMETHLDNLNISWKGDVGLTIKGAKFNDLIYLYEDSILKKSIVSNGSDIIISPIDVVQPFNGRIILISRPYMYPLAKYYGSLDWNDMLIYSNGILKKNPSGIQSVNILGGSECNTISDWTFTYNLISGGTTPIFSSSSGYIRFDCNQISYYNPWGWNSPPVCEAWFYLRFNISEMVKNLTISLYADGLFTYFSGGYIFEQWGEILLYLIQGNNWTLLTQSPRSISPSLNTSISISPNNFITIDAVVIAFHTYARGQTHYSIYSNSIWGRVDYLRLSYQKMPDNYSGPSIINLQPGWRVVINSSICWANHLGVAIIPKNTTSWPANLSIVIYPPSEVYIESFRAGHLYYLYSYKTYLPKIDKIFYQVLHNDIELHRTELTLINHSPSLMSYIFTFKSFNNGKLISDYMPKVFVDGVEQKPIRIASYTYQIIARRGALLEIYDRFGVRLSATLP